MSNDLAIYLSKQLLWHALFIAAPIILVSLISGLIISILQVVTQIQDSTLSFVPQLLGTIQLAKFINPETLDPIGSGIYIPTDESGDPLTDIPGNSGLGSLAQNQIEGSNVDMVRSLMQLTMAQHVYQLNAKAVQIADGLGKLTNEIRD